MQKQKEELHLPLVKMKVNQFIGQNQQLLTKKYQQILKSIQYKKFLKQLLDQDNYQIKFPQRYIRKIISHALKKQNEQFLSNDQDISDSLLHQNQQNHFLDQSTIMYKEGAQIFAPIKLIKHKNEGQKNPQGLETASKQVNQEVLISKDQIKISDLLLNQQQIRNKSSAQLSIYDSYLQNQALHQCLVDLNKEITFVKNKIKQQNRVNNLKRQKYLKQMKPLSCFFQKKNPGVSPCSSETMHNLPKNRQEKHIEMKIGETKFLFQKQSPQVVRAISYKPNLNQKQVPSQKRCLKCPNRTLKDSLGISTGLGKECRSKQIQKLLKKFNMF